MMRRSFKAKAFAGLLVFNWASLFLLFPTSSLFGQGSQSSVGAISKVKQSGSVDVGPTSPIVSFLSLSGLAIMRESSSDPAIRRTSTAGARCRLQCARSGSHSDYCRSNSRLAISLRDE